MAIGEIETQNLILDSWLGPARAAGVPAAYDIEVWAGDPRDEDEGSHEVVGSGYSATSWDSDDWDDADGGQKQTNADLTWTLTDGLDDAATHWVLRNQTSGDRAYSGPLAERIFVAGAGTLTVRPTIPFADAE